MDIQGVTLDELRKMKDIEGLAGVRGFRRVNLSGTGMDF